MKSIRFSAFILLVLGSISINGQDQPYALSMNQACDYALQHNKTLLNARDQVASSTEMIREARAQGLPQIDGSIDFMTYFNYEMEFSLGSGSGGTLPTFYDAGDEQLYYDIMGMFGSSEPIVMDNQMSGKLQLSQLIFSGQYWAGLQAAKIAKELSNQNVVKTEHDVKESVINLYYLILVTEKSLGIVQENITNLTGTLQHTENMYKSGVAEITDVDQLKITVSGLKNSEKAVERAIQMSYNMLRFQLGVAPDAKIMLSDSLDVFLTQINAANSLNTGFDITQNINYSLMETQVKLSEKQLGLKNWSFAPTIAGYYSYTKKILTTGFDMTPNHLAGITMTVPVFSSGMRRAQVSQARIGLDMAERNRDMVKEQLETQKNELLFNYQNAFENYVTQKENVATAGRVYTNIHNKYNQGMVSSLDLTQASSNLLGAENNYLSAVLTLLQAQTSLNKLFNTI